TPAVSGSATSLQALEPSFQQDLNGDGRIGLPAPPPPPPPTVIESMGATDLVRVGNNFFMYAHGDSSGPELQAGGTAFVAGQFGAWTPIGAEVLSGGGYEVAWKFGSANLYTVWTTDSSGNNQSSLPGMSGSDLTLQGLEPSFQQDLNG